MVASVLKCRPRGAFRAARSPSTITKSTWRKWSTRSGSRTAPRAPKEIGAYDGVPIIYVYAKPGLVP